MRQGNFNMQAVVPMTPVVRNLIIVNTVIWFFITVIIEPYFLQAPFFTRYFGLIPALAVEKFFIWQFVSYMFFHALSITHVLFNMLLLWWLGSELEQRWGSRFFLLYYMVCGVGAGLIYTLILTSYQLVIGGSSAWGVPVVGASGAVFGLLLAYGIIFGERVIHFMMIFPMKAKFFVMILAGIELVTVLNAGVGSDSNVANLAHLGGLVSGYIFLFFYTRYYVGRQGIGGTGKSRGRNLKLVVNNEPSKSKDPKFWN